jgi:predicted nucleic acid-binding protein
LSLYAPDINSDRAVIELAKAHKPILSSAAVYLEATNAFQLMVFRGYATKVNAVTALRDFEQDIDRGVFQMFPVPPLAWETARNLSIRRSASLGTRSLDILHVAMALTLHADVFLTFDRQQAELARAEGLATPFAL